MDPVIQNALKRRSELRAELRDVERFLELYQHFKPEREPRQTSLDMVVAKESIVEHFENKTADTEGDDVENNPSPTRMELLPHIRDVIAEAKRPLTRGQILLRLDNRGIRVGGKADRSKNMGTILWRLRDEFVNLPGVGYWPRGTRYEPAGYDPTDDNSPEAVEHTLRTEPPVEQD